MAYGAAQFALNKRMSDGATLRQHLEMAFQATGIEPQQLADAPPLPPLAAQVWEWFAELSDARSYGFSGPNPIGYNALKAWAELTGARPEPWEIRAIRLLDVEFIKGAASAE